MGVGQAWSDAVCVDRVQAWVWGAERPAGRRFHSDPCGAGGLVLSGTAREGQVTAGGLGDWACWEQIWVP